MDYMSYLNMARDWFLSTGLKILLLILLVILVLKALKALSPRISKAMILNKDDPESEKRAKTLGAVVHNLFRIVILILAGMTLLAQLGVAIGPLLATAGIVLGAFLGLKALERWAA